MLQKDVKTYVKSCNICLASKAVCYKPLWRLLITVSSNQLVERSVNGLCHRFFNLSQLEG